MAGVSSFYKGEKKKLSKEEMLRHAKKLGKSWGLPRVEIVGKKKNK